jgi:Mg/Co/Ni transporter MgtE
MKSKDWKGLSKALMVGSLIAVVMSGIGYLGTDIWLASTQWLLVAAVLALFGMFAKLSSK